MKPRYRSVLAIEALESRLAPTVTIVNATTATFTDVDGDKATVKVSSGTLVAGLFTTFATGLGDQLQRINLSGGGFDGANLSVTAIKSATGDGLVNVGYVNSTGHDLGTVKIAGDLGQIDAGDSDPALAALAALNVRSLGRFSTDTQAAGGNLQSDIIGALGTLTVKTDVIDAFIQVNDGADGKIGSIGIGGSLVGGASDDSGRIFSSGNMGAVRIGLDIQGGDGLRSGQVSGLGNLASFAVGGSIIGGGGNSSGGLLMNGSGIAVGPVRVAHDLLGGTEFDTGQIAIFGHAASVTIGGSIVGGTSNNSGVIFCTGKLGPVRVAHDVVGGSALSAGRILGIMKLASVTIGGSLIGGTATLTGCILSSFDIGPVRIGHNFTGGSIGGTTPNLQDSGVIGSNDGRIASITIGGSIIGGSDTSTAGILLNNASIDAGNDIGALIVKGNVIGNSNPNGTNVVEISARGQAAPGLTTDLAFGKINIGGRVEFARFLAGYDTDQSAKNADAQIGSVTVGGDWLASNLIAGVEDGIDNQFGTADDVKIAIGDTAGRVSRINSVTIKGQAHGTPPSLYALDHFGFVAQQIGTLIVGAHSFALAAGPANDLAGLAIGLTGDLRVREVAL